MGRRSWFSGFSYCNGSLITCESKSGIGMNDTRRALVEGEGGGGIVFYGIVFLDKKARKPFGETSAGGHFVDKGKLTEGRAPGGPLKEQQACTQKKPDMGKQEVVQLLRKRNIAPPRGRCVRQKGRRRSRICLKRDERLLERRQKRITMEGGRGRSL